MRHGETGRYLLGWYYLQCQSNWNDPKPFRPAFRSNECHVKRLRAIRSFVVPERNVSRKFVRRQAVDVAVTSNPIPCK